MSLPRLLVALLALAIVGGMVWLVLDDVPGVDPLETDERDAPRNRTDESDDVGAPPLPADIRGRVLGPDGAGYAGATVRLWREERATDHEIPPLPARVFECLAFAASVREAPLRIESRAATPIPEAMDSVNSASDGSYRIPVALGHAYRVSATAAGLSAGLSPVLRAGDRADLRLSAGTSVRGRVEGADGAPVAGAAILLEPDGRNTTSRADGAFEISGLAPGARTLHARASGHGTARLPVVVPAEGLDRVVRLPRGLIVDILVEGEDADERERRFAGAVVVLVGVESGEFHQVTTGEGGRARIEGITPGVYTAVAHVKGSIPHSIWMIGILKDRTVSFYLEPEAVSTILVLGPDGRPVADARFLLPDADGEMDARVSREVGRTDADGRFRFAFDDDSREVLWVAAPGFTAGLVEPDDPAEVEEITVLLRYGASLMGRVVDEEGRPIAGAVVLVESDHDDADDEVVSTVLTGEDGTFHVDNLLRGEVDVEVTAAGFRPADAMIEALAPGQPALEIVLSRGLEVRGRVVDAAGAGVAGVTVGARGASREVVRTDPAGAFRIGAIATRFAARDVRLELTSGALVWSAMTRVGQEAVITVPVSVELAGRVVSGEDDAPIASYRIDVVGGDGRVRQRIAITDAAGAFRIEVPDEPDLVVRVKAEIRETWSARLSGIPTAERSRMQVRLETPARLRVSVTGANGRPVPAARVQVTSRDGGWSHTAVTAASGIATIRGAPGTVRLRVTHRAYTGVSVEGVGLAAGRETREDVRLTPGGAVRVRILRGGKPILTSATRFRSAASSGGNEICVLTSRGTPALSVNVTGPGAAVLALIRQTTEGDTLVLRGLPAGSYSVNAVSGSNRSPSVPFQMGAGTTMSVDLDLGR